MSEVEDVILSKGGQEKSHVFRKLFNLPKSERLEINYSCAYLKKILLQGRLYLSKNYLCFYSNVFGYETRVVLAMADIVDVSKKNTAMVIPNAIEVDTLDSKYFFASFLSRDHAFDNIKERVRAYQEPRSHIPRSPQEEAPVFEAKEKEQEEEDSESNERGITVNPLLKAEGEHKNNELPSERSLVSTQTVIEPEEMGVRDDIENKENIDDQSGHINEEKDSKRPARPKLQKTGSEIKGKEENKSDDVEEAALKKKQPIIPTAETQFRTSHRTFPKRVPSNPKDSKTKTKTKTPSPPRRGSHSQSPPRTDATRPKAKKPNPRVVSEQQPTSTVRKRRVGRAVSAMTGESSGSHVSPPGLVSTSKSSRITSRPRNLARSESYDSVSSETKDQRAKKNSAKHPPPIKTPVFESPLPPSLDGRGVVDFTRAGVARYPFSSRAFWDMFMSDTCEAPMGEFHRLEGDEQFKYTVWKPVPGKSKGLTRTRDIFFIKTNLSGPLGPKQTRVHKIQRSLTLPGLLVIDSHSIMPDVPYGGYFHVAIRWVIVDTKTYNHGVPAKYKKYCPTHEPTQVDDKPKLEKKGMTCCLAQMWTSVEFSKFTVIKYQIRSFANTGVRGFVKNWIKYSKAQIEALPSSVLKALRAKDEAMGPVAVEPAGPVGVGVELIDSKKGSAASVAQKLMAPSPPVQRTPVGKGGLLKYVGGMVVGDEGLLTLAEGVGLALVLLVVLFVMVLLVTVGYWRSPSQELIAEEAKRLVASASSLATTGALAQVNALARDLPPSMNLALMEAQAGSIGEGLEGILIREEANEKQELLSLRDDMLQLRDRLAVLKARMIQEETQE
uniref:VASt domain-containing protein n=1 Tax=Lotharella globosa TaxID=91324 RepID=A0A7S4DSP1_9EUKA|mmetsp:Transcript_12789/g.26111  ORF Transcript_12789/g.26111 Transcript_12789/m.26111 type:complete len:836 (+) Transcript_12789:70-2577(+)